MKTSTVAVEKAKCPECGGPAEYEIVKGQTTIINDEGQEETIDLHPGFTVTCPKCGVIDGEPPQY